MWEKLNIFGFGWNKKKATPQPVQREIPITITNGDRKEVIQRSPSGTKLASSSTARNRLDDDESSDGTTSINFGFKTGPSPRRASSFSFTREPLDLPTWSNVTSPGFTSRLVQQASGHSPLTEFNDSLSHSPFRKSPHKDLGLGELPFVNFSRKPSVSSPLSFSNRSLRPGVSSSMYNRDRRRHARQGQVFVRIAPIDPSVKGSFSITRKSGSPAVGMGGSPYPGSPRAGSEPYRPDGLGGISQQEMAMRFNRMWPSPPGSPVPGPGRPLSPTAPSNIMMEALASGRKRGRDSEAYYPGPPNATPPSVSPPTKISIGIGDTPVRSHPMQKRVKFIGSPGPEGRDRPMMVPYSGMGGGEHEPLSSESILEQMNQTEKRFLPESSSTPYSIQKKPSIRMSEEPTTSGAAGSSGLRKRRSQSNIINPVDEESTREKFARYCCPCNDCYAEATGNSPLNRSEVSSIGSPSKADLDDSSTSNSTFGFLRRGKKTCDVGVGTDASRAEYFKELFKRAEKKRKPEKDDIDEELTRLGTTIVTKEMYDRDKKRRIERYYRLLKLKPPGEGDNVEPELQNTSGLQNTSLPTNPIANGVSGTQSETNSGFNFASPAPAAPPSSSSSGFLFGKQTSPVAQTTTTNSCPTITSPSVTASAFNNTLANTAPTVSNTSFGTGTLGSTTSALNTSITASSTAGGFTFGGQASNTTSTSATPSLGGGSTPFSSQTNPAAPTTEIYAPPQPVTSPAAPAKVYFGDANTNQPKDSSTTTTGGFNFSGGASIPTFGGTSTNAASAQPVPTTNPPLFGIGSTSSSSLDQASKTEPAKETKATDNANSPPSSTLTAPPSIFGSASSEGNKTAEKPAAPAPQSAPGFGFGLTSPAATTTTAASSTTQSSDASSSGVFQLGQPSALGSTPFQFGQQASSGGFSFSGKPGGNQTGDKVGEDKAASKEIPVLSSTINKPASSDPPADTNSGFRFGSSMPTSGFSFGNAGTGTPAGTATEANKNSVTTASATSPTNTSSSIFGGVTGSSGPAVTKSSFSFGAASTTPSNPPPPYGSTTSTPAFGSSTSTFGQTTTAATTFGSAGANIFGGGGITSATTTAPPVPTFGSGLGLPSTLSSSTTNAGATPAQPSLNFGSGSAFSSGGAVTFGSVSNSPAQQRPAETPSLPSTTNAGIGGFNFSAGASSPPAFGGFGSTAASQSSSSQIPSTSSSSFGTFGQSPFANVPNPLANRSATTAAGAGPSTFGGFSNPSSSSTTSSPPVFGSFGGASSPPAPVFGGGAGSTTSNQPFAFGQNSANQPQQPQSSGFSFGGSGAMSPPTAAPAQPSPGGFSFGQSTAPSQPNQGGAVFQFGQPQNPGAASPFQFGQQPAQGIQGGFNMGDQAAVGQPMFSVGTTSTAPRRRDLRRRHR